MEYKVDDKTPTTTPLVARTQALPLSLKGVSAIGAPIVVALRPLTERLFDE